MLPILIFVPWTHHNHISPTTYAFINLTPYIIASWETPNYIICVSSNYMSLPPCIVVTWLSPNYMSYQIYIIARWISHNYINLQPYMVLTWTICTYTILQSYIVLNWTNHKYIRLAIHNFYESWFTNLIIHKLQLITCYTNCYKLFKQIVLSVSLHTLIVIIIPLLARKRALSHKQKKPASRRRDIL